MEKIWSLFWLLYYEYNPIVVFFIRPALRIADAHNYPIRGGFAAALSSLVAHYLIIFYMWRGETLMESYLNIPSRVHICVFVAVAVNVVIGFVRYFSGEYGDREIGS
ncbi:hypothetical protein ACFL16_03085 [Patescibacteria group bacterium]